MGMNCCCPKWTVGHRLVEHLVFTWRVKSHFKRTILSAINRQSKRYPYRRTNSPRKWRWLDKKRITHQLLCPGRRRFFVVTAMESNHYNSMRVNAEGMATRPESSRTRPRACASDGAHMRPWQDNALGDEHMKVLVIYNLRGWNMWL